MTRKIGPRIFLLWTRHLSRWQSNSNLWGQACSAWLWLGPTNYRTLFLIIFILGAVSNIYSSLLLHTFLLFLPTWSNFLLFPSVTPCLFSIISFDLEQPSSFFLIAPSQFFASFSDLEQPAKSCLLCSKNPTSPNSSPRLPPYSMKKAATNQWQPSSI